MNKYEIIEILKIDGLKIAEVELPLRDDDELISTALKQNGLALAYLSELVKADKKIVLLAIEQNPYSIQFAAQSLIDDLEILKAAYSRDNIASNFENPGQLNLIQYASIEIQSNIVILLELLTYSSSLIHSFPPNFLSEEYFMSQAVTKNGTIIEYASDEIKNNRNIVLAAAKSNGNFMSYQRFNQFINDREIMLAACFSNSNVIKYLPHDFKNDLDFVLELLKKSDCSSNLQFFPEEFLYDKKVILNGFHYNYRLLLNVIRDKKLLNDEQFILQIFEEIKSNHKFFGAFLKLIEFESYRKLLEDSNDIKIQTQKKNFMKNIMKKNSATNNYLKKYL